MESKLGSIFALVGAIIELVMAVVVFILAVISFVGLILINTIVPWIVGLLFIVAAVAYLILGFYGLSASRWMKNPATTRKGGITALVVGIISVIISVIPGIFLIIGGVLGLVDAEKSRSTPPRALRRR